MGVVQREWPVGHPETNRIPKTNRILMEKNPMTAMTSGNAQLDHEPNVEDAFWAQPHNITKDFFLTMLSGSSIGAKRPLRP